MSYSHIMAKGCLLKASGSRPKRSIPFYHFLYNMVINIGHYYPETKKRILLKIYTVYLSCSCTWLLRDGFLKMFLTFGLYLNFNRQFFCVNRRYSFVYLYLNAHKRMHSLIYFTRRTNSALIFPKLFWHRIVLNKFQPLVCLAK